MYIPGLLSIVIVLLLLLGTRRVLLAACSADGFLQLSCLKSEEDFFVPLQARVYVYSGASMFWGFLVTTSR
tara:strand:+ start:24 stop:236 length:213 start_codon:yes stop_codon:yes gene_type:complete